MNERAGKSSRSFFLSCDIFRARRKWSRIDCFINYIYDKLNKYEYIEPALFDAPGIKNEFSCYSQENMKTIKSVIYVYRSTMLV